MSWNGKRFPTRTLTRLSRSPMGLHDIKNRDPKKVPPSASRSFPSLRSAAGLTPRGPGTNIGPFGARAERGGRMKGRVDSLLVEPMRDDFILWRCLHGGPLTPETIDDPAPHPQIDWPATRARNIPLLRRLIRTYGSCAILARDGDQVLATVRFYPKELCEFGEGGAAFCLQQAHPAGPRDDLAGRTWPDAAEMRERVLFVHCLMVTAPSGDPDRYRRRGVGTRLARELVRWARAGGWEAIEATAYEEIPVLYAISGVAGKRFWEKLGFRVIHADTEPAMSGELLEAVQRDAVAAGIPAERAANRYAMRLDLAS